MGALLRRIAAAALLASALTPAWAVNELFAKDAPVARMTAEDFRIAGAVMRKALDEGKDGQSHAWSNPATKASGTVTPDAAVERQGLRCRPVKFSSTVRGQSGASEWILCKTPKGWKVLEGR